MRLVNGSQLIALTLGQYIRDQHLLHRAGQLHFALQGLLLYLLLEQALVFDCNRDNVRDRRDELDLVVNIVLFADAADQGVCNRCFLVVDRDDDVKVLQDFRIRLLDGVEPVVPEQDLFGLPGEQEFVSIAFGYAIPLLTYPDKQRHGVDTHFPANERLVHVEKPAGRDIVVDGLGNGKQTFDLKLLQVKLALKFFQLFFLSAHQHRVRFIQ